MPSEDSFKNAEFADAKTHAFLTAMAKGRHRKGSGNRLRKLIASKEISEFGVLACFCCGGPASIKKTNIEHIVPEALGGKLVLTNLALSHPACNTLRGSSGTPRVPAKPSKP
jgi:5-methylcytosine-specific restriction endonuclease McrA